MNDLRKMWEIGGLIADQNDDQVADQVNVYINLENCPYPEGLIDFCARLGLETSSLSFDFFHDSERYTYQLIFVKSDVETYVQWKNNQFIITYDGQKKLSQLLRFLAGQWHVNFGNDNTPITKIILSDNIVTLVGDCGNKKEISLATTETYSPSRQYNINSLTDVWSKFGFLHKEEPSPNNIHAITFKPDQNLEAKTWIEIFYGASRIGMESTSLAFPLTGEYSKNPLTLSFQPNSSNKASIQLEGSSINFSGNNEALFQATSYFFREKHWSFGGHFGTWENRRKTIPSEEKLFHLEWCDDSEVEELYRLLDDLKMNYSTTAITDINVLISEPKEIRDEIFQTIQCQFGHANIIVRSAYKPGYFWLMEEIVPTLKTLDEKIGFITIKCLQEEKEDGLELPIRWIQELYPVDEKLSKQLSIDVSNVDFELCVDLDATYKIFVYDEQGHLLYNNHLDIPVSKVPYVEDGKYSYPTTSFLSVYERDQQLVHTMIQTDRERFYMYYFGEVLPKLWEVADRSDENSGFYKPLFDRIEIEVEMSEEELKIPVEEERISSLEALHEDLYFNTLDYFTIKGEQSIGKGYTAPGGIYPFLYVKPGAKPKATIKAYKWVEQQTETILTKKIFFNSEQKNPTEVTIQAGNEVMNEIISDDVRVQKVPEDVPQPNVARIRPWLVDYSYRGEPIFVYEFFNDINEEYYSAIKLSTFKPTILIETGHHANEVSSSPAVVEMLDEIVQTYPEIIKNSNIVVIPRANPDGTALHQKLIKDNPEWKHHAARFNAVGLEFAFVRYQNSSFGEANVVPNIMNRWAPDIVIDNHGIPSHEWAQPFAGYHIPPRFKMSFWIPNAMLYGIAQKLDEKKYPQHKNVLDKITKSIQNKVKNTDIHHLNQYWMNRYKKYGHRFMPELFPIELTEDLIFYKWPIEPKPDSCVAISRFPDWVSADILSEVPDETVHGEALAVCKQAQRIFDLGAIEWINKDIQPLKRSYFKNEIRISRIRPLKC